MKQNSNSKSIKPTDKVCMNCKYLIWSVGVGVGVLCKCESNRIKDGTSSKYFAVPNRRYTCEYFEIKNKESE